METLPAEVLRCVFDRLHWRDLLAVSSCATWTRDVAARDERAWERRCRERFTASELSRLTTKTEEEDREARASSASSASSAPRSWRRLFTRSVRDAVDAIDASRPTLIVTEYNEPTHYSRVRWAFSRCRDLALADLREFILSPNSSRPGGAQTDPDPPPTLLVLAGMTAILARDHASSSTAVADALRAAGAGAGDAAAAADARDDVGARRVKVTTWTLGRLEGVGFRLRDDVFVVEGSLESLARDNPNDVWKRLGRGIRHETRDMEIVVVGPRRAHWWSALGGAAAAAAGGGGRRSAREARRRTGGGGSEAGRARRRRCDISSVRVFLLSCITP